MFYTRTPSGRYIPAKSDAIINEAREQIAQRYLRAANIHSPETARDFCMLQLQHLEHEVFGVVFLDSQHQVLGFREMFNGTINQATIYPREILKAVLEFNAGAVILCHNHPSGNPEPSAADETLTRTLNTALQMIDVRVLDHIVVGGKNTVSFAERGLI